MTLPANVSTVTVTSGPHTTAGGTPQTGTVLAFPSTTITHTATGQVLHPEPEVAQLDANGLATFTPLCASDSPNINVTGFTWTFQFQVAGVKITDKTALLPLSVPSVNIDLAVPAAASGGTSVLYPTTPQSPYTPQMYGAKGDLRYVRDCSTTNLSTTVSSATAAFTSLDVGKTVTVLGAGAAGANLVATVVSVTSATAVVLTVAAGATLSNANLNIGTDDTTAVNACITAAAAAGRNVSIPLIAGAGHLLTSGISWDASKHNIVGAGDVRLDFTAMTSGRAVSVTGWGGKVAADYSHKTVLHAFEGLQVWGPDYDATAVDGFYFNDASGPDGATLARLHVFGFRDNFSYDTNNWALNHIAVASGHAHRRNLNFQSGTNAGESYRFIGCTFYSSTNAGGTAVACYTDVAGNPDIYFYGCSFDYNDIEIVHASGAVNLIGCHVENSSAGPMFFTSYTGGNGRTSLQFQGGFVSPTEVAASARDHLWEHTAGDKAALGWNGTQWNTFDKSTTIFKATGGFPGFSHVGGMLDLGSGGTRAASGGQYTSLFPNGDLETSTSFVTSGAGFGWEKQGTATYTIDGTDFHSGTRSLHISGPGGSYSSSVGALFPVVAGKRLHITVWRKVTNYAAGNQQARIGWFFAFNSTSTNRISVQNIGTTLTANQGWTPTTLEVTVPAGSVWAYLDFLQTNLQGDVFVDDVCVTQL